MKITLSKPFVHEDYNIAEIDLDLKGKINPKIQEILESRYKREILRNSKDISSEERGVYMTKPILDKRFIFMVFEQVTGLPKEVIRNETFDIEMYNVILDSITYFFMNWKEPSMELPTESEDMDEASSMDYDELY